MNTLRLLLTLSLAASAAAMAKEQSSAPARTDVIYTNPEKFTDVKDSDFGTDKGRDAILAELKDFIVNRADKLLAPDQKLTVNFTDIDLAGEYEPWRGPRFNDVRIVKDIYPPRLKFSYKVTNASGAVVKEGTKELRDLAFQSRITIDNQDRLRYEKDLLNDWMRSDLRTKS